jgi:hypothetical protein
MQTDTLMDQKIRGNTSTGRPSGSKDFLAELKINFTKRYCQARRVAPNSRKKFNTGSVPPCSPCSPIKYSKKHGIYLHFVIPCIRIIDTSGKYVGKLYIVWSDINPIYNQEDIVLMKLRREGGIDNSLL